MDKEKKSTESLKLGNQLCFPMYTVSRLLTRAYKPYLDEMGITYPQYLVMLVLWEEDCRTVNQISEKLLLNTNTISPLLKRMEHLELITRNRCQLDERSVIISLSKKGVAMKQVAASIPDQMLDILMTGSIQLEEIKQFKGVLENWINVLTEEQKHT